MANVASGGGLVNVPEKPSYVPAASSSRAEGSSSLRTSEMARKVGWYSCKQRTAVLWVGDG